MNNNRIRAFHADDGGFSTVGMVLAMLITLSLIFTSAQVFRIQSASANVQNVADAAALAAENQVASFYVVAQVCDAVVLSMSLTGICVAGLGVACMCVPLAQEISVELENAALKIFQARNKFSKEASQGLNKLQKLLPFIAAAQAFAIASSNGGPEGSYIGCAVLLPFEGEEIQIDDLEGSQEVMDNIDEEGEQIKEAAQDAEEAAKAANEHKFAAYLADCGNNPEYCMYQRAETLAGMTGPDNPMYRSVDSWSFSVALRRAQAYYPKRFALEQPKDNSTNEQANSAIRKNYYEYASGEIAKGYVYEDPESGSFDAYFPLLPKNTEQMRSTELYTQMVYPITTSSSGKSMMHAWSGCPQAQSQASEGIGSVAMMESGDFETCPACEFSAASVGTVASASSSISNGFEYHYRIVAEQAQEYQKAAEKLAPSKAKVKGKAGDLLEQLKELADQAIATRIYVKPPGRYGCVAIVVSTTGVSPESMFPSSFVSNSRSLGTRAAISASTLAEDDSSETQTVITDLLSGFSREVGGSGSTPLVLKLWSGLLLAYNDGQDALLSNIRTALNKLPLVGESGLGQWASSKLESVIESLGLEPAQLYAYKPVLVNSSRVIEADTSTFSQSLLSVKTTFARVPASGSPLSAAVAGVESYANDAVINGEQELLIASVNLLGVDVDDLPFSIALPPAAQDVSAASVSKVFSIIQGLADSVASSREWR